MKSIFKIFVVLAAFWVVYPHELPAEERDVIYQVAPIQGLSAGIYDGFFSLGSLKKHGDMGLGTFNAPDGEMVCVDGAFYQVKWNGKVVSISESALTPFAVVTFFDTDQLIETGAVDSFADLVRLLDGKFATKNLFYALRIDGIFEFIRVRSVPAQAKPYPPLAEALKQQTVFEYNNIAGTLVGFRSPSFADKINVAGYHFHFLSADKQTGGHLLDLRFKKLNVLVDQSSSMLFVLPENKDFFNANLDGEQQKNLRAIE